LYPERDPESMAKTSTDAVQRVYLEMHERLYRTLLGYSGSRAIAGDALAEAFAQALAHLEGIRDVQAWVWRTAFRIAAGELQRRAKEVHGELDRAQPPTFTEPLDHLLRALQSISAKQRMAVVLHDYADLPNDEIARVMGIARATVYVHLSQGRKRLRSILEDSNEDLG
jgi:RNA polymerase sigma-70 factor, ECF subfamily